MRAVVPLRFWRLSGNTDSGFSALHRLLMIAATRLAVTLLMIEVERREMPVLEMKLKRLLLNTALSNLNNLLDGENYHRARKESNRKASRIGKQYPFFMAGLVQLILCMESPLAWLFAITGIPAILVAIAVKIGAYLAQI